MDELEIFKGEVKDQPGYVCFGHVVKEQTGDCNRCVLDNLNIFCKNYSPMQIENFTSEHKGDYSNIFIRRILKR